MNLSPALPATGCLTTRAFHKLQQAHYDQACVTARQNQQPAPYQWDYFFGNRFTNKPKQNGYVAWSPRSIVRAPQKERALNAIKPLGTR
jgi:hypothetical protein